MVQKTGSEDRVFYQREVALPQEVQSCSEDRFRRQSVLPKRGCFTTRGTKLFRRQSILLKRVLYHKKYKLVQKTECSAKESALPQEVQSGSEDRAVY